METLFNADLNPPAEQPATDRDFSCRSLLKPTPHLHALDDYGEGQRPAADPIGQQGLPSNRTELDSLVVSLCERLWSNGDSPIRGNTLAAELHLRDTRPLRLLVAYAHVHHRIRAIVGVPGSGYLWGPNVTGVYDTMAGQARKMGRCFFFLSALYGKGTPAVEAAQLMLEFANDHRHDPGQQDDLATMMRAEGVGVEQVLSAIIDQLAQSDDGRRALAVVGRKHESVLIPSATLDQVETALSAAIESIRTARRSA